MKKNNWAKKPQTTRICDHAACNEPGTCRAPKDRSLNSYYWFCPKHAAEYNKNWDFYLGLSSEEIEQHLRNDTTWQRPTWRLGQNGSFKTDRLRDSFGIFEEVGLGMDGKHTPPPPKIKHEKKYVEAARFMELTIPFTKIELKKQYKKLAKLYHPDTATGDEKQAAKLFQKLSDAYTYLSERLG